jgi:GTP:adenosylcobinamide-phosphate guanylyltransferase
MAGTATYSALVLAGKRGPTDPLAEQFGCRHKALLPIGGVPMLVRVVRALEGSRRIGRITVAVDAPSVLELPELRPLVASGSLVTTACAASPSRTVLECLRGGVVRPPVLVTTADHALLTPAMVSHFCDGIGRVSADVVVGVVRASVLHGRFPHARRTLIRLRDEAYKGANLFACLTPQAAVVAEFWARAERFRKQPWRLVGMFGPLTLALFLLRRFDLTAALARASRIIDARLAAIEMPFAECAIDVDVPDDVALVTAILESQIAPPSGR